jgi:hypothetical protein
MSVIYQSLPFLAAISLLIVGVVRLRRFLFIASFLVLVLASIFTLIADGTSEAISFAGGFILLFGVVCLVLSRNLRPNDFASCAGLRFTGTSFISFGFVLMMVI